MKSGCAILFFKEQPDRVLLYRRDNSPGLLFAGYLDLLGGHIEEGETAANALVREVAEELFDKRAQAPLRLEHFTLFRHYTDSYGYEQHIYAAPADFDLDDVELREGKELVWITENDLQHQEIAFRFNSLVQSFFDYLKKK